MKNIDSYVLNKLNEKEWTIAAKAEPKIEVLVTRPRMAITDNNYFTTEKIREKTGLTDIAVSPRRMILQDYPDKIFEIHIDEGLVKTAFRDYPDTFDRGWQDGNIIEAGKRVGIAFNGHWERFENRWIVITNEEPFIFWIDSSDELKTQMWHDNDTRISIATGVKEVTTIRAWKSVAVGEDDNGVIAAYIKTDNKLYYRTYAEQSSGDYAWEPEREMSLSYTPKTINLFLTNDYRTGIIIEDISGNVHYKITDRNWAGMGIQAENVNIRVGLGFDYIEIGKKSANTAENLNIDVSLVSLLGYTHQDNKITSCANVDLDGDMGQKIVVKTAHDIHSAEIGDWEIVDTESTTKQAVIYTASDMKRKHEIVFQNFNNLVGDITLRYKGVNGTNALGDLYSAMEYTFTPTGLIPTVIPPPIITNNGDRELRVAFQEPVTFDITKIPDSLSITSIGYEDTRRITFVDDTHDIESLSSDGNTLIVTLTYDTRMKRAKEVTLNYNSVLGGIDGADSFIETFEPTGYDLYLDPYVSESVNIDVSLDVDYILITKKEGYTSENVNIDVNLILDYIHIDDLNP